ncbi:MAG: protoporphyrinogen oxidase [Haloarculaceae archaeon]
MGVATVGVVGAGITGLAVTHYLAEYGVDCVTFEAGAEPGGVIESRVVEGRVLEAGPQRMRKTPAVADLLQDLGIDDETIEAPELPLYVYADGELGEAPLSREAFLRSGLLSWRGKLRLLAEPLTSAGSPDETVAELFTRKFGREAYETFIGPLYGGIYGSDPARMPARYALSGLLEREQEVGNMLTAFRRRIGGTDGPPPPISFADGMQTLPRALANAHAGAIDLGTPVRDVSIAGESGGPTGGSPGDFVLETPGGDLAVDHLVVTTPADVASALLDGVAAGAAGLAALTYNPLAIVHLLADVDVEGMGYQVAFGEDLHTLGSSWNASLFDREGVYTVFLGGMHEPDIVGASDEHLATVATREFREVMGADPAVLGVTRLERGFPAYDRSWTALDDLDLPAGVHMATNYRSRMGVPSRIREASDLAGSIAAAVD